jgi:hypothetical protein
MKLYRSKKYPNRWFAHSPAMGWIMFPAVPEGWRERVPARGIDPIDIREVPLELAFDCGVPGSPGATVGEAA